KQKGQGRGGSAVLTIPALPAPTSLRLQQVAASLSLCLTRTEGYCLTLCGYFDVLLPGTGKTSSNLPTFCKVCCWKC
uniref:Uncharacterized protein n=1 Tax=Junco hyemalis TaxID=40217 RepID=A0A8C5IES0_JUNHY